MSASSDLKSRPASEVKLERPPDDGITAVQFSPSSSRHLLASSWDCSVRLYDVHANSVQTMYSHAAAVLTCCFKDATHAISAGLDNTLKLCDLSSGSESVLGQHGAPVRCVEYADECSLVVSGGWDEQLMLWDPRSNTPCTGSYQLPHRCYALSTSGWRAVVGTAGRKVFVWDLRNMSHPVQKKDSSLKYQTRCIKCFANRQGYVLSSIEGRVAVEYFDLSEDVQKKKYAFKCHRIKEAGMEYVYPVNAVDFHRQHNTFATGGSDGFVNVWDGVNKKRLCQLRRYHTSIASLAFSVDGTLLAIAVSYQYEQKQHPDPLPANEIFIRHLTDHEIKPK